VNIIHSNTNEDSMLQKMLCKMNLCGFMSAFVVSYIQISCNLHNTKWQSEMNDLLLVDGPAPANNATPSVSKSVQKKILTLVIVYLIVEGILMYLVTLCCSK